MVMIATKAGFSAALGAFVMGSLLAETVEAEKWKSWKKRGRSPLMVKVPR